MHYKFQHILILKTPTLLNVVPNKVKNKSHRLTPILSILGMILINAIDSIESASSLHNNS